MIENAIKTLDGHETGFCPGCDNMWDGETMCPVCYPKKLTVTERISDAWDSFTAGIRSMVEGCLRWLFSLMPTKKFEAKACRGCEQPVQFDDAYVNERHRYELDLHQWCADEHGQPLHPWDKTARSAPALPPKPKKVSRRV